MKHLTNREMQQILASISVLHSEHDTLSFHARIFGAVKQIVPGEFFALDYFYPQGEWLGRDRGETEPRNIAAPELADVFAEFAPQHPLLQEFLRTKLAAPRKITDFVTTRQFHTCAVYNEFYRLMGTDTQIAVGFPITPEIFLLLSLNRNKKDFTERERWLLTLLRPHMITAYQNAAAFARLQLQQLQLQTALEKTGGGAILLDADGRIQIVTERAQRWLVKYFAAPHGCAADLPEELTRWIKHYAAETGQDKRLTEPSLTLTLERANGCLLVRLLRDAETWSILLLLEEKAGRSAQTLEAMGLTKRETEILFWLTEGKTNPEIAILCDISPRTVQKHLEHIYQKLGVETRTAAARRALDLP